MRAKVLAVIGTAAMLATAGLSGVSTAKAQVDPGGLSDIVAFRGCTNVLTPAVPLVGGPGGSYGFGSDSACNPPFNTVPNLCTGISDPGDGSLPGGVEAPANCTIHAGGSYSNIVCGTGTTGSPPSFADSATVWADDPPSVNNTATAAYATIKYSIVFVAGVGVIVGTSTEADSVTLQPVSVLGVVQITPTGGDCVNGVTQFVATGVTALLDAPTGP
jgi:hypothetical protein